MADDLFKNKYRIKSTRLPGWDYSKNGYYFVTICVKNRECAFGKVEGDEMVLSDIGKRAEQCWRDIPEHFPFVKLDAFVVMPNHVHGIIVIARDDPVETQNFASLRLSEKPSSNNQFGPQSKNLASIVRGYKIGVTKYAGKNNIAFQWQSRYYDHIIRDEKSLNKIRQYIVQNPLNWRTDVENPVGECK